MSAIQTQTGEQHDCQNATATSCSSRARTYSRNETAETFDEMNLRDPLLRGIYGYGFERPTAVQQQAILPCISGRDVVVQAQSGTGKTATYIIPTLQRLDETCRECQALIVVPTRELAQGISRMVLALGEYMDVTCHVCIGGSSVRDDIKRFEAGVQIVVGTPGRVLDMLKRSALQTKDLKICVLDEADELLSRGFAEQIRDILMMVAKDSQMLLFSSTMPADILEMTNSFMNDPVKVLIKAEEHTLEGIRQFYVDVEREQYKFDVLCDICETASASQLLIYCETRRTVDFVTQAMRSRNMAALSMTGDTDNKERNTIIQEFQTGSKRILITTDLLTPNIDKSRVKMLINYDLPLQLETYIHRVGYSGRFPPRHIVINFVTPEEQNTVRQIERFYNTQIDVLPTDLADFI